jgi:hypothetical protein
MPSHLNIFAHSKSQELLLRLNWDFGTHYMTSASLKKCCDNKLIADVLF